MVALTVTAVTASLLVGVSPARAVGSYDNATIATEGLSHLGHIGGTCKAFVNNMVSAASGGTQWPAPGYNSGYQNAGGIEVTGASATKGDVIQVGDSDTDNPLHSAIVVQNKGGGVYNVVDSNWVEKQGDPAYTVHQHDWTPPTGSRFWRMGTVNSVGTIGTRLLANVDGDSQNKADAVVVFSDTGTAMVATSNGGGFSEPQPWSSTPNMAGATKYFLGEVTGDNKADLVGFWNNGGVWKVISSNGVGFVGEPITFATDQGIGTTKQWIANVGGDSKADMVTFDAATGDWWVSISDGSGFGPNQVLWSHGNGIGSTDQVVADFTGDGKADLGVYFASNGYWWVTPSGAGPPFAAINWSQGHGMNSDQRLVGDLDGNNKADEALFFNSGIWDCGMSVGTTFLAPTRWAVGQGVGTTERFLAKVNNDNMADLVTFDRATGDWWVSLSAGTAFWPPGRWIQGHGAGS